MPRPNRNMRRVSIFVPGAHADIVNKLARRKGLNPSDIYRAMLKRFLVQEVKAAQTPDTQEAKPQEDNDAG